MPRTSFTKLFKLTSLNTKLSVSFFFDGFSFSTITGFCGGVFGGVGNDRIGLLFIVDDAAAFGDG